MRFNKAIVLILAIFLMASPAFAASNYNLARHYTIENKAATNLVTYIPTTNTTVGDYGDYVFPLNTKILGYEVRPEALAGSNAVGAWATLYDATSASQLVRGEVFGEIEALANSSEYYPFPEGREVTNGLTIIQSAKSVVIIYYSR